MKFYMGNKLSNVLPNLRLCSFSRVKDDPLMWSYYSNGHKGVAIGVRINDVRYSIEPVNYNKDLPSVSRRKIKDINGSGKYILTHKLKNWCHEQETRVFLEDNEFIDAEIVEINTGRCISDQDYCLICKLVSRINPNIKIIKAETFMGFPDFLINDAIDTPGVIPIPCDFARAIF
ncbi:MAG: DUF2971 domain-containing protein [Firmicutes bacterium]|nr:DUF2971 domain-containing protein [Bacillota bacterium]